MYEAATRQVSVDPIISRLRPRTVGEILDQAFRLYRRNFLTFVAIIAVVVVPLQLAQQIVSALLLGSVTSYTPGLGNDFSSGSSQSSLNGFLAYSGVLEGASILLTLISALLQSLSQAALTAEIANSHLDKPVSFRDGYRQMFSRLGPLLGAISLELVIGIAIFLPIILVFVLAIAASLNSAFSSGVSGSSNLDSGIIALYCFSCFMFIPAIGFLAYVFTRLYVVTPALMVERLGPVQAIRRSWRLVQNYWWRTFGMLLLLAVLGSAVAAGPAFLIRIIVLIVTPRDLVMQQIVSGLVTVFISVLFIPIQLTAVTLYYFDLRVRKEGYDLETALSQRYAMAPQLPPAWAGAGYGQPGSTTPVMPPPSLGQGQSYGYDYSQYGQYGQYGPQYGQGAPTQPVGEQEPRSRADTGPLPSEDTSPPSET